MRSKRRKRRRRRRRRRMGWCKDAYVHIIILILLADILWNYRPDEKCHVCMERLKVQAISYDGWSGIL